MLNAKYTMCYHDVLQLYPDVVEGVLLDTPARTKALRDMIYAKFFNWEIAGETIPEFKLFLTTKCNQYAAYYIEMLDGYEIEFDWKKGYQTSDTTEGSHDVTKTFTPRAKYEETTEPGVTMTTEDYDLPRSTATESRPSSKSVSTPSGSTTVTTEGVDGNDTTRDAGTDSTTTTRTGVNLVEQRKKYLDTGSAEALPDERAERV